MTAATANHAMLAGFPLVPGSTWPEIPVHVRHRRALVPGSTWPAIADHADRVFQNSILTELPGAMFAFLTLAYIVVSLVSL